MIMSNIGRSAIGSVFIPTISATVYQTMRELIVNQTFAPGQRLQVDELAQQLGVSRTPVKDALNQLASEGLIKITPRRGTFVAELTPEEVMETYEVRQALELAAAERLVRSITSEDLHALERALHELEALAQSNAEIDDHVRKNAAFHELFVQLSGNRKLLEMYRGLNAAIHITRIHHYRSSNWQRRLGQEGLEHHAILQALRDHDLAALEEAIKTHLRRAWQSLADDMVVASGGHL